MVENVLKKIDKIEENNNQIDLKEIQTALDDWFFDKEGKEDRISDLITQLNENKRESLVSTYSDTLRKEVNEMKNLKAYILYVMNFYANYYKVCR